MAYVLVLSSMDRSGCCEHHRVGVDPVNTQGVFGTSIDRMQFGMAAFQNALDIPNCHYRVIMLHFVGQCSDWLHTATTAMSLLGMPCHL